MLKPELLRSFINCALNQICCLSILLFINLCCLLTMWFRKEMFRIRDAFISIAKGALYIRIQTFHSIQAIYTESRKHDKEMGTETDLLMLSQTILADSLDRRMHAKKIIQGNSEKCFKIGCLY